MGYRIGDEPDIGTQVPKTPDDAPDPADPQHSPGPVPTSEPLKTPPLTAPH